jgi:hypothetical protein
MEEFSISIGRVIIGAIILIGGLLALYLVPIILKKKKRDKWIQEYQKEKTSVTDTDIQPFKSNEINLPEKELVYLKIEDVKWAVQKIKTTGIKYVGVSFRIPIAKGISYKVGSVSPKFKKEIVSEVEAIGTLYVTNKKILLYSISGAKNLNLKKVLNFNVVPGIIQIIKDSGIPIMLILSKNDVRSIVLFERAIELIYKDIST